MKYPLAFRIFASLNIIGFLVFFIQAVALFLQPASSPWIFIASCFSAVWFLVASFLWFFGSSRSYSLLLTNAAVLWLMTGTVYYQGFIKGSAVSGTDKIIFLLYVCIGLLYSVFLLLSLRFAPIKEWSKATQSKILDPRISVSFFVSLLACIGAFYYLETFGRTFIVLENIPPMEKASANEMYVNLSYLTEMDGLAVLNKTGAKEVEAYLYFSPDYEARSEAEFSNILKVTFKPFSIGNLRSGEAMPTSSTSDNFLYVRFPVVSARRFMVRTIQPDQFTEESMFTTLHSVAFLDRSTSGNNFITENAEDYESDEQYFNDEPDYASDYIEVSQPDESEPHTFSKEYALHLYNGFLQDRISENQWYYFNTSVPSITINGQDVGHYLNFASILEYVPASLNQYLADKAGSEEVINYSLNSGIWKLTGLNLSTNYEYPDSKFKYINPRLVRWVRENLLVDGNEKIGDQTAREVYHKVFKRMFWQLAAAHEYLQKNDFDKEVSAYKNAMEETGFRGNFYIYDRFENVDGTKEFFSAVKENNPETEGDYYYFTEQVALGFWIRRKIDGSEEELWKLVKEVFQKYDTYPFSGN